MAGIASKDSDTIADAINLHNEDAATSPANSTPQARRDGFEGWRTRCDAAASSLEH